MKYEKKFTIIQLRQIETDREVKLKLSYGGIEGPYYDQTYPEQQFDSEEDAIKYAWEKDKWQQWIVVPLIKFDPFDE